MRIEENRILLSWIRPGTGIHPGRCRRLSDMGGGEGWYIYPAKPTSLVQGSGGVFLGTDIRSGERLLWISSVDFQD